MAQVAKTGGTAASKVFQGFRAVGLVTADIPFVLNRLGQENFLTVSLGKSFQVYKCEKLTVALVSPQLDRKIRALACKGSDATFTASGREIVVWARTEIRYRLKKHEQNVDFILFLGDYLVSVDSSGTFITWDISGTPKTEPELISTNKLPPGFTTSSIMHPNTYLNKILFASEEGEMLLWNLRKEKCIYKFKGWGSPVHCVVNSPVVDNVGIGLADGRCVIHNLKFDETLMTFSHTNEGAVSAISFMTDPLKGPLCVTGSDAGEILVWDLEQKKLSSVIREAHEGRVVSVEFLLNEPVLVSSGADNSIKMWIFDNLDGSARLLKSREGHKSPPHLIRYYGATTLTTMGDGADGTACQILSAGQDKAFRVFHTVRDQQSREMSQGPLVKKARKLDVKLEALRLPAIVRFAASETRQRDWANIITCHEDDPTAYVWHFEQRAIGKHPLRQFDAAKSGAGEEGWVRVRERAMSVAISACGNFGLVGTYGGAIFKYNMQSGQRRGAYPSAVARKVKVKLLSLPGLPVTPKEEDDSGDGHEGAVFGLAVDATNRYLISGSADGTLKWWDFRTHKLEQSLDVGSAVTHLELHRDSGLLAVACDDLVIRVYDIATRQLVRRFHGHTHRVSDICFTPDARWLISASLDSTIRVWDLPSGRCVDWLKFRKPVTGVTVSPNGEFLATSHVDNVGIFLWANKSLFTDVYLDTSPVEPYAMDLPGVKPSEIGLGPDQADPQEGADGNPTVVRTENSVPASEEGPVRPLAANVATLSGLPPTMWQTLLNLELIKARNKPKEPPKAPEKAPFFLPTIHRDGVNPSFATKEEVAVNGQTSLPAWGDFEDGDDNAGWEQPDEAVRDKAADQQTSRVVKTTAIFDQPRCRLDSLLHEFELRPAKEAASSVTEYLTTLGASSVDVELSSLCLGTFDDRGILNLHKMLQYLKIEIASKKNFEVIQAYLHRFLHNYADIIAQREDLLEKVSVLKETQHKAWMSMQDLLYNNMCLVQYLSNIQT